MRSLIRQAAAGFVLAASLALPAGAQTAPAAPPEVAKGPPAGFVAPAEPKADESNAVRGKISAAFHIFEAAIVAAIQLAVGTNRQSIGTTTGRCNGFLGTIWLNARYLALLYLGQDDAAIWHDHRPLGKA